MISGEREESKLTLMAKGCVKANLLLIVCIYFLSRDKHYITSPPTDPDIEHYVAARSSPKN